MGNDRFPTGFIAGLPTFKLVDSVITQPKNGRLVGTSYGANSRLIYVNETAPVNSIDSFQYRIRMPNGRSDLPAMVYIYVLQDENGATGCVGQPYRVKMKAIPSGTTFGWYESYPNNVYAGGGPTTCDIPSLLNDFTLEVKPNNVGNAAHGWNVAGGFPPGKFTVHASLNGEQMRWTGDVNSDWNNPANWVMIRSVGESPVTFQPGLCTNVIIPSSVNNFPELDADSARCKTIRMMDRAMLKNPHVLNYETASVELKLKPAERDRFVMWSAPLKDMYSGDYHYRQNNQAVWGDVFMNMFQLQNPDYTSSTPVRNRMTATFANRDKPLTLGTAFNLKVQSTTVTRDSLLRFPRSNTQYEGPILSRTNSGRFITDGYQNDPFDMPVTGSNTLSGSAGIVQVVNPYMAYLDIAQFLSQSTALLFKGCYIWNGEVNSPLNAIAVTNGGDNQYRIIVNDGSAAYAQTGFIPPLQSFFVAVSNPVTTLKMSRAWTTTSPATSYNLRAAIKSGGVLSISLSGANKTAHATLVYEPSASNFSSDKIDMPAVTYTIDGETPLSLYTLSADAAPLVINASSTFDMLPVNLGLIAKEAGEYTLSFGGLYSFGYDVSLTDVVLNKRIELSSSVDEYKFTLTKPSSNSIEVNDRFKLYFKFTGKGIIFSANEELKIDPIKVTSNNGYINITSNNTAISNLRIYDAYGRSIYQTSVPSNSIRIPASSGLYIVKAAIGNEEMTEKIIVK